MADAADAGLAAAVPEEARGRLPFAIAVISAAALAYQLLLMRWLAIEHWHPFAVMIISLALLGHGASGTWLAVWLRGRGNEYLAPRFEGVFSVCALLFAVSAALALLVARAIPFNGLELVWDPRQLLWLGALYLVLAVPFFFAASCFGLAFARHGARIPALYGADLIGASVGALVALALSYLPTGRGLVLAALGGTWAAFLVSRVNWRRIVALLVAIVLVTLIPTKLMLPQPNPYKGLSKALLLPEAHVVAQRWGPYGWMTVLDSPQVPLRYAPGMSLGFTGEPPAQRGLFTDGDGLSVITYSAGAAPREWLDAMTSALPYHARQPRSVLVLGAGGGMEVLQALALGAGRVEAVELSAQRLGMVRVDEARYAGQLYRDPRVHTVVAEPRAHVRADRRQHDLIVLAGGESFASGGAGVQSASEQYALTVEAMGDYLERLSPTGMIAITRWSKQPPRDELKLAATMAGTLRLHGVAMPARHVAAIRNWDASTWLLSRRPFTPAEVTAMARFAEQRGFDAVLLPGVRLDPANNLHVLDPPYLFNGAQALLSPRANRFADDYKFMIEPASDDRPYFGHYFRWRSLPELWKLRGEGSAVLLDSGYLLLVAALVQALPLAVLLVLLPLRALGQGDAAQSAGISRTRAAAYFTALGLAFLLIEIATLSRLTLLVGHPLLAATAGLAGVLLFAGAGSLQAQRWLARRDATPLAITLHIRWAVRAIALGLLWQVAMFAIAMEYAASWSPMARALLGLVGIAPMAFAMGMPFPLGLARLARTAPGFVPWAWGLNGCASVLAAILALLLAMAFGLRATLLIALVLYVFAAWVWPVKASDQ
ncbi:hypothetical protein HIV01_012595 [Lysobacter arenosi]|uniref:SAM-dependent methyltransferase n=1 Tax=Lysobacter arenosi TaxID=2795387 RepID=A0ABX7RAN2_9GAMM|nr:hypothetical protein [Lysobacter arenosi]QSX74051.1 hypothetical protein HIV01_012595 [Lysobacter arenosi]